MAPTVPPLTDLKVLDLSRILAGPVCCQLLGDLGADVVKVERPGLGDDTRQWGPPFLGETGPSAYFLSANRAKRSLAVDFDQPLSRDLLHDLIRQADVLVENFRPSTLRRLGLLPEDLARLNPRLVVGSISGYGRDGAHAQQPGYDLMIQAGSGMMSITGEPGGAPMKVGVAITDVLTGLYTATVVLAGLHARKRDSAPRAFDVSLADCALASLVNVAQSALLTNRRPTRWGNAHPNIVPYESFAACDGHFVLAVGNDTQWQRFCRIVGFSDLAEDARFRTNPDRVEHRARLIPRLQTLFAGQSVQHWIDLLQSADVPCAKVVVVDEVLQQESTARREMVVETRDAQGRPFQMIGCAVHWQNQDRSDVRAPPALGQHTAEVLTEWLGYDSRRIDTLVREGVVAISSDGT
jgi:formyl-CoA transferase